MGQYLKQALGEEYNERGIQFAQDLAITFPQRPHDYETTTSGTVSRGTATKGGGSSGKMMPRPASHRNHATLDQLKFWVLSVSIVP